MRYLPHTDADRSRMLRAIGIRSIDELFADVPAGKLLQSLPGLPPPMGEIEVEQVLTRLAQHNIPAGAMAFFIGCGAYRHHVPATVDHLVQRSEFLTSYTPYQPEISQGNLQAMFEFQTQVARLTGMEIANASMYDGSTATAEAVLMAHRITRRRKAILSGTLHPHYRAVIETLSHYGTFVVEALPTHPEGDRDIQARLDDETSAVVVQYPDVFGRITDLGPIAAAAHARGALLVVAVTEAVALGLVTSPGEMGADIVAMEGQSLGNPLSFGGPYVGMIAARAGHVRQMPGRLVGETVDAEGKRGFVLTLSAREQHIRRERATSNICTNAALCALAFSIHLTLLGEQGLRRLAAINHANACDLAEKLGRIGGVEILTTTFFNEFTIRVPAEGGNVIDRLLARKILGGVPMSRLVPGEERLRDLIVVASTEMNTPEDREAYASALSEVLQ